MNAYILTDLTNSKQVATVFAKSERSAKAWWTRKGNVYVKFLGCRQVK